MGMHRVYCNIKFAPFFIKSIGVQKSILFLAFHTTATQSTNKAIYPSCLNFFFPPKKKEKKESHLQHMAAALAYFLLPVIHRWIYRRLFCLINLMYCTAQWFWNFSVFFGKMFSIYEILKQKMGSFAVLLTVHFHQTRKRHLLPCQLIPQGLFCRCTFSIAKTPLLKHAWRLQ